MNKKLRVSPILMAALVSLIAGCATIQKFNHISVGMTKEQAIEQLGEPVDVSASGSKELLFYDEYTGRSSFKERYVVAINNGKVDKYGAIDAVFPPSIEELERRARAADRSMQMMTMMNAQRNQRESQTQSPAPIRLYQPPRPVQTQCQTRMMGGTAQTDCTSAATGIDASIYQ